MKIAALEFIAIIEYNVGEPLPKEAVEISYNSDIVQKGRGGG